MTRDELIRRITEMSTQSYSLPTSLPKRHVELIIDMAERFFYSKVDRAVIRHWYVIPKESFETADFKAHRRMTLPDCVVSVYEVREMNGGSRIGNIDRDFSDNRLMASELFLNNQGGDAMVYRTAAYAYYDLGKAFITTYIQFDFDPLSHQLRLEGRDPRFNVLLKCYLKIEANALYEDDLFIRYCLAQAKIELGRMLGFFTYNLPGGVTINFADLKADGQTELEAIKQEIIDEQSAGDLGVTSYH